MMIFEEKKLHRCFPRRSVFYIQ